MAYASGIGVPWDLARVVHLHRRAGFAATWTEIQRDLRDGPEASVTRVLQGKSRIDGNVKDFETVSAALADSAASTAAPDRLKAWWVFRMLFSPDPLGERLTLLWHNHFATSNLKVNDLSAMRRQNEILRQYARAPFGELLRHVIKDPAMLDWLDAPANRKEHPNENLARESMELFTIGVGNFSETDVKEAARALTGWSFKPDGFHEFLQYHDGGEKSILGRKGRWRGDEFVSMLLEQPATSVRLAKRLCEMFMGEQAATPEHLQDLAKGLREHQLDVGWAVERILRSRAFFADSNLRSQIVAPPEFAIGATRALEQFEPPPSTLLLAEWIARMGQDLFYPPNVFGWPGGRNWLNSRALVARINFAAALVGGTVRYPAAPANVLELVERAVGGAEAGPGIRFLSHLLLGIEPPNSSQKALQSAVGTASALTAGSARQVAIILLSSPQAQIG
ncbi:MAG TPA: DUF1800 domain-containing protein [Planctomycetaceae bacterium]|nr:DUF1800 domain-containing protein [Planctomycetaceae bacterium]